MEQVLELNELKYFVAVAKVENINKAAESLHISPGALSKAIARLERELDIPLFFREKQRICLTAAGDDLKGKAIDILNREEDARLSIGQATHRLNLQMAGEEVLLSGFAPEILKNVKARFPNLHASMTHCAESQVWQKLKSYECHMALTTKEKSGFKSRQIGQTKFKTVVGMDHPLASSLEPVHIKTLLAFDFITPKKSFYGYMENVINYDGWRDDEFPRKIAYAADGMHTLLSMVNVGLGIAYVPDYIIEKHNLKALDVSGCPYTCEQTVFLTVKEPVQWGWLNQVY